MLQRELLYAALGTGFTCGATILGAAMVLVVFALLLLLFPVQKTSWYLL